MHEIAIQNVNFSYGSQTVLEEINLTAQAGEFVCLLGPSGCGKSTLLRLLAGLGLPTSGCITLDGTPITGPGLDRGVVFQDYSLFPWMTTGQNVVLALNQAFPGKSKAEQAETAQAYLEMVGLTDVFHKLPGALSGGMRQRAAIARAFAINSPVLLMDEPFGALDAITRARLQDLLLQLWQHNSQERKTVFFVTHDVEEAILLANRVVVMGLNPGSVRGVFEVNIPRPRQRQDLYSNPAFTRLRDQLIRELNADVLQELDGGRTVQSAGEAI
ncbi:ABC transporter ATP-binding protein [Geomonas subterranea]|uniref:ABC transporter ATP-binding protein n=1 Tax=Geomonas subterranea TaxID=2847989 RepID=A0ABX8LL97_9BACT|nr:ABC transporter ATP-binding protein [Geomonas subterranea]QXE91409.1 ABC transporter ATP-binding protein [Geomonas subterranea]QXM10503.1 ABC transporter ATP-binding protein [Geomonas subterranea]